MKRAISATVLLKGFPKHLDRVLASLAFLDEVLVYDNGASEEALQVCCRFANVRLLAGAFYGFGKTHNLASAQAKNAWIFSVDSDEVVSGDLRGELEGLVLEKGVVYSIPRHNYFQGKWIKGCGWYPDRVCRLYCKDSTEFTEAFVHERVKTEGLKEVQLKGALQHYSYDTIADFLSKMQSYTELFAKENRGKRSSSPWKAMSHGAFAFLRSYVIKRGFMDGFQGYIISAYNAQTAYYKYLKLHEANLRLQIGEL
jgi:hypothetical protein